MIFHETHRAIWLEILETVCQKNEDLFGQSYQSLIKERLESVSLAHFLQIDIVRLLKNFVDLVVARAKPPPHVLVVQHLDLEGEVLLHVLDDHDEVGQLDAQRLLGIRGTSQKGRVHVGADNLQHEGLTENKLFGSYTEATFQTPRPPSPGYPGL